jgi:hypothetical protein
MPKRNFRAWQAAALINILAVTDSLKLSSPNFDSHNSDEKSVKNPEHEDRIKKTWKKIEEAEKLGELHENTEPDFHERDEKHAADTYQEYCDSCKLW